MDKAGQELLGLLDGLPLALAQAAAYLRETGLDVASYVRLYTEQWDHLMSSDEGDSPLVDYEQSVGTTWTISFKAIKAKSESAANLLCVWAFLGNQDLWHGLLQAASDDGQWPGWLSEMADNEGRVCACGSTASPLLDGRSPGICARKLHDASCSTQVDGAHTRRR